MDTLYSFLTHPVDDLPLLVGVLRAMQLERICDAILPTHGNTRRQNTLTNGQALCIWLLYLLSQGDHRKWHVEEWVAANTAVLSRLWGCPVAASDFTDDRLTTLLTYLAQTEYHAAVDRELFRQTVSVYELTTTHLRLDATLLTGYHHARPQGLMQYGHARGTDDGTTQGKLMAAATATGHYLTGQYHPGSCADDPLYAPLLARLYTWDLPAGLLVVGDCKMGALATRHNIASHQHYYYLPLADSMIPAADWTTWVDQAVAGRLEVFAEFAPLWRDEELLGYGYAFPRVLTVEGCQWTERVQVIRSLGLVDAERKDLDRRMAKARAALDKLTPPPRQRVKSYPDEGVLRHAITTLLHNDQVDGLFVVQTARDPACPTKAAPAGCYRISTVAVDEEAYREHVRRCGWRVYVTNAPQERLSLAAGVLMYRQGAGQGIERMNKLLKDHETLGLDRLYVHTASQIIGLAYFISLALRILTYLETTVRKSLAAEQATLPDYAPDGQASAIPTAKTMLARIGFRRVTLIEWCGPGGHTIWELSELPEILLQILHHMHLSPQLYYQLLEEPQSARGEEGSRWYF
jgi:transposase